MNNTNDLVYFELNNWFAGRDYPPEEPFTSWISHHSFSNDVWCKKNRLVVLVGTIDMSTNWCIAAPKDWVKENCPALLYGKHYTYTTIIHQNGEDIRKTHEKSMSDFIRYPDEDGNVYGRFGWRFPEYTEENFGNTYYECEEE